MERYKIIYEDMWQVQDIIYISCNRKPTKTEVKHMLFEECGIRKLKVIDIIPVEN